MSEPLIDVTSLHEANRDLLKIQVKNAFDNRIHTHTVGNTTQYDLDRISKLGEFASKTEMIETEGEYSPKPDEVVTQNSHDYPYLLQIAIETMTGRPLNYGERVVDLYEMAKHKFEHYV